MYYAELRRAQQELTGPGGAFEIIEASVKGRRMKVFLNAPRSVREFWLATAQFADRTYLVYQDERLTYGETHKRANALANWLWGQGVRPGDRVAIAMRNYPEWLISYWACLSMGVTAVGINTWWIGAEMAYALADSTPKAIIADGESLVRISEQSDTLGTTRIIGVRFNRDQVAAFADFTPWEAIMAGASVMPEVDVEPDDDACIFYTSGTTGFPKGARLTHRGCVMNLLQMQFARAATDLAAQRATQGSGEASATEAPALQPAMLITTPLFHVTANNCCTYPTTAIGGAVVLMHRWDAGTALRLIESERITAMSGVPVMAREVLAHPDFGKTDTSSLVSLAGGGAPLPPDLVAKIETQSRNARPSTGYGLTEVSGIIAWNGDDFFIDKPESVGMPFPTFDVRIVDDNGASVAEGEPGELWIRGAARIAGYLNEPENSSTEIRDGWLHTGDLARIDEDGFLFIVGRKKDMVLRGGENIACGDVEAGLYRHPAVAECCVFSVPDERLGEEVGAAVLLKPGSNVDAETLREHCRTLMAKYKVPRYLWIVPDPLPRNASGKFLRKDIQARLVGTPAT